MDNRSAKHLLTIFLRTAFCVLISNGVGWSQQPEGPVPCPEALIAIPFASNTTCRYALGKTQLVYRVEEGYPADDALKTIYTTLGQQGWKPLKRDFLNPSIPSSHMRGWTQFEDDTTTPHTTVHAWQTQWMNQRKDVVDSILEYRYPVGEAPDLHTLHVVALFIDANIAAESQGRAPKHAQ